MTRTGRIYIITSEHTKNSYIGSTTGSLIERLKVHRRCYKCYSNGNTNKYMTSFELLKLGKCHISLLRKIEFETVKELRKVEGEEIQKHLNVVNANIAGRTRKETYDAYRKNNIDRITEKLECACGSNYTRQNKQQHYKTNKHQEFLKSH